MSNLQLKPKLAHLDLAYTANSVEEVTCYFRRLLSRTSINSNFFHVGNFVINVMDHIRTESMQSLFLKSASKRAIVTICMYHNLQANACSCAFLVANCHTQLKKTRDQKENVVLEYSPPPHPAPTQLYYALVYIVCRTTMNYGVVSVTCIIVHLRLMHCLFSTFWMQAEILISLRGLRRTGDISSLLKVILLNGPSFLCTVNQIWNI
jgi:hypothetical protein